MLTDLVVTAFTWNVVHSSLYPCTVTVSLWEFWKTKFLSVPHLTYKAKITVLSFVWDVYSRL